MRIRVSCHVVTLCCWIHKPYPGKKWLLQFHHFDVFHIDNFLSSTSFQHFKRAAKLRQWTVSLMSMALSYPLDNTYTRFEFDITSSCFSGYDINALNEDKHTPLFIAAEHKKIDMVQLLTERGTSLAVAEKASDDPLCKAATTAAVNIVRYLAGHYNSQSKKEMINRALIAGVKNHNVKVVEVLLDNGAVLKECEDSGVSKKIIQTFFISIQMLNITSQCVFSIDDITKPLC